MGDDRVEGTIKEATGKVKEEWGDLTDNPRTEAEGKLEQAEGGAQKTWGDVKDKADDLLDDDKR